MCILLNIWKKFLDDIESFKKEKTLGASNNFDFKIFHYLNKGEDGLH